MSMPVDFSSHGEIKQVYRLLKFLCRALLIVESNNYISQAFDWL